jgi:hypothetical protein
MRALRRYPLSLARIRRVPSEKCITCLMWAKVRSVTWYVSSLCGQVRERVRSVSRESDQVIPGAGTTPISLLHLFLPPPPPLSQAMCGDDQDCLSYEALSDGLGRLNLPGGPVRLSAEDFEVQISIYLSIYLSSDIYIYI